MSENQDISEWEKFLRKELEELEFLEGDELDVYLLLLKAQNDLTGVEIVTKFSNLKRTNVYAILNRLQRKGWIELTNPGKRPALYRGMNPLRYLEKVIGIEKKHLDRLERLENFINDEVIPELSTKQLYGGRVSNTFIIPTVKELYNQITEYARKAKIRVMGHASFNFLYDLKHVIADSINRMLKKVKADGIEITGEFRRDHFAIILAGDSLKELQNNFPIRIILDQSELQTQIIVIDDIVFLTNLSTAFDFSLRIQDPFVSSVYALLLSQIFIEKEIETLGKSEIEVLGTIMAKEEKIRKTVATLFEKGWKSVPDHTNELGTEIGLVSPGTERAFYRLGGIQYFPFKESFSKSKQIEDLYEQAIIKAQGYISRLKKQLIIKEKRDEIDIYGTHCLIYKTATKVRKEWASILGLSPVVKPINELNEGINLATFNFYDKGAMCIWGINHSNVRALLEEILKKN